MRSKRNFVAVRRSLDAALSALTVSVIGLSCLALSGCTSPVDTSSDDIVTAQGKLLPFTYDTNVDTITHMSCTNMPAANTSAINSSAYFTYRVGAYSQGGILLTQTFFDQLKKYRANMQEEILAASPANSSTVLQLALRSRSNYQNLFTRNSTAAQANMDYYNMLAPLGTDEVASSFVESPQGSRIRHLRSGSAGGYRLEGSLIFTDSPSMTQATRAFLQGGGADAGLIAVTYSNGDATSARSVANTVVGSTVNPASSVFGKGYRPSFSQPTAVGITVEPTTRPSNVFTVGDSSMTEMMLDGTTTAGKWTCPVNLQMKIIRAADASGGLASSMCLMKSDPAMTTLTIEKQNRLTILRRTLRLEDWYIDLDNNCVVSKHKNQTDCYGNVTLPVNYALQEKCGYDATGLSTCAQFTSTCYRTN